MTRPTRTAAGLLALGVALALGAPAAGAAKKPTKPTTKKKVKKKTATPLVGTFLIERGNLVEEVVVGSYFRVRQPDRAYTPNPTSSATDETYTFLAPGEAGGLVTGEYQQPSGRTFEAEGHSLAGAIIEPTFFQGVALGLASLPKDPASRKSSDAPTVTLNKGKLYGRVAALTASWNKSVFNQGSPKPGKKKPVAVGTYDKKTSRYTLHWSSKITSGPFKGSTGVWHLEGTFEAAEVEVKPEKRPAAKKKRGS